MKKNEVKKEEITMTTIKKNNGNQKPIIPINYNGLIDDFFRTKKYEEKYIKPFIKKINAEYTIPEFRIELRDLGDQLLKRFKDVPKLFLEVIKERLFEMVRYDLETKEILENLNIKEDDLHVIPDSIEKENLIPRIEDLTINKTNFLDHFSISEGRYMTKGIDRFTRFNKIKYRCSSCGKEWDEHYRNNIDEKIKKPKECMKKICKNTDLEVIDSEPFEVGFFMIDNLDFNKSGNYVDCYIINNIDYFIEKIETINLGEEVEVLGILRTNYSDLITRKESQKFDYYIEVFDIKPKKLKSFNKAIIEKLEEKLQNINSYFEKLIDAIHPLTYFLDMYYPIKLLHVMSFITGGSWNHKDKIRDTINCLIAGAKSTYKSSISRNLESIVGKRHYRVHEVNKEMTKAGLIGTTQRDSNKLSPTIRYGLLLLYSNGTLVFDEAQKIQEDILDVLRCLEKGDIGAIQDAIFTGDVKESVVLSQNFVINNDGSFNGYAGDLFKNLGWKDKNCESRLERFDLLYIIPVPDTFIKIRTLGNEEKISKDTLLEEIAQDLELEDYDFPKGIKSIRNKIEYLLYQYFHKTKELYRKINLLEEYKDALRNLYKKVLSDKKDRFKTDTDVNIRSLNICYKVLKCLSSLRFFKKVENTSFNYFKKKVMKFVIPFRESKLIETIHIDMDKIFQDTFGSFEQDEITAKEIIDEIRAYIKRTYYNDKSDEVFEKEIKDYLGSDYNLRGNYEFKKLLTNNEAWLKESDFYIESERGKGKTTTIKKIQD